MGRAFAGFWGINITQWIKAPLPWPIQDGLLLKHVLLLSVFCCGVQQFSGQMWRIFAKGMSGMVGFFLLIAPCTEQKVPAIILQNVCGAEHRPLSLCSVLITTLLIFRILCRCVAACTGSTQSIPYSSSVCGYLGGTSNMRVSLCRCLRRSGATSLH